jgi:hypothetical protein
MNTPHAVFTFVIFPPQSFHDVSLSFTWLFAMQTCFEVHKSWRRMRELKWEYLFAFMALMDGRRNGTRRSDGVDVVRYESTEIDEKECEMRLGVKNKVICRVMVFSAQ